MNTTRKEMRDLMLGDEFTVNGQKHTASTDAHISGDSTCDEYVVYDENDGGWFESDFPEKLTYRVPFAYQRYGRIDIESDKPLSREEMIQKAAEKLEKMSVKDMDYLADYLENSEEIDEEGIIFDDTGNPIDD